MSNKMCHLPLVLRSLYQTYSSGRIIQMRIQDFPDEVLTPNGVVSTYYLGHSATNYKKLKKKRWTNGCMLP